MKKAMGPNGLRSSGTGPTAKDVNVVMPKRVLAVEVGL